MLAPRVGRLPVRVPSAYLTHPHLCDTVRYSTKSIMLIQKPTPPAGRYLKLRTIVGLYRTGSACELRQYISVTYLQLFTLHLRNRPSSRQHREIHAYIQPSVVIVLYRCGLWVSKFFDIFSWHKLLVIIFKIIIIIKSRILSIPLRRLLCLIHLYLIPKIIYQYISLN